MTRIRLVDCDLVAELDPEHGAEILSVRQGDRELLFRTPWHEHADAILAAEGNAAFPVSPDAWLRRYRGGWQTLSPTAGDAEEYGRPASYHGEASSAAWHVRAQNGHDCTLRLELSSIPLAITRVVSVRDGRVTINDELENLAHHAIAFDYGHHPAFGSSLLDSRLDIDAAARFVPDEPVPDEPLPWPEAVAKSGDRIALSVVEPGVRRGVYGWLEGFEQPRVLLDSAAAGITTVLEWDPVAMPYAWVWQELGWSTEAPWCGSSRTIAVEPMSRPTRIADREGSLRLAARERRTTWIRLSVEDTRRVPHR
ncbi:aldose epimerase family protein [Rathayibacter sp. CAU 1779]